MDSCQCSIPVESDRSGSKPQVALGDGACPTNGMVGKRVDTQIVRAMLALPLTLLTAQPYCFCADPDCPTVYYSEDGQQVFVEDDLRERVYQKHADDKDISVCYCFHHTVRSISSEIAKSGQPTVVAEITAGIQAGQCACDIRNPQGNCCLGNVRAVVKHFSNQP